jgi:PAS domain S-box-containing protein
MVRLSHTLLQKILSFLHADSLLRKSIGPVLTLFIVYIAESMYRSGLTLQSAIGLFAVVVVFSIIYSGTISGIVSALIGNIYFNAHYIGVLCLEPNNVHYVPHPLNTLVFTMIVLAMGEMRNRLARNMKALKKSEENARENEEKYRLIFENSPVGIEIYDRHGILLDANRSCLDLFGVYSLEDVKGFNLLNDPNMTEEMKLRLANGVTVRGNVDFDFMLVKQNHLYATHKSSKMEIDVFITPLMLANEVTGYLVMVHDITEQKQSIQLKADMLLNTKLMKEAIEGEKMKTEFFSNISHELRTPLNVILSTVQMSELHIRNSQIIDTEGKLERYMKMIRQNCNRLVRLVNNLIDITRIDAGYFELYPEETNIVSVVEEITLSVSQYVQSKGLSLVFDTEIEEKIVCCDADKMERIMLNLLSNAVKFTKPGGNIMVRVLDADIIVEIRVSDTGIGIPIEKQAMIFERFYQADPSLTRNHEGSGIGLSLVKSLVEMQGGSIEVESVYGEGSTFIIRLPVLSYSYEEAACARSSDYSHIEKVSVEFSDL